LATDRLTFETNDATTEKLKQTMQQLKKLKQTMQQLKTKAFDKSGH